jgi:hypothetical protein
LKTNAQATLVEVPDFHHGKCRPCSHCAKDRLVGA